MREGTGSFGHEIPCPDPSLINQQDCLVNIPKGNVHGKRRTKKSSHSDSAWTKVSESFIEAPFCLLKKTYQYYHTTPTKTSEKKVKIQTYQCQLRPSNHLEPLWPGTMTNGNAVDGLRMKSTNRHRWTTCQTCVETTPMGPTKNSKMPSDLKGGTYQTNSLDSFKISAS